MNNLRKNPRSVVTMDIPAINACAAYSFGYSNIHRKLAKQRAQQEGRVDVNESDIEATASEACRLFMAELEQRAAPAGEL